MSSDLQRFLRAVRTLARLGDKYDLKNHLDTLEKYATAKQKDDVLNASALLDPIAQALVKQRLEHVEHRCRQCGHNLDTTLIPNALLGIKTPGMQVSLSERRADRQYCDPTCRQRAYRARVTAKAAKREQKRHVVTDSTAKRSLKRHGNGASDPPAIAEMDGGRS